MPSQAQRTGELLKLYNATHELGRQQKDTEIPRHSMEEYVLCVLIPRIKIHSIASPSPKHIRKETPMLCYL